MRCFTVVLSVALAGCGGCGDETNVGKLPDAPPKEPERVTLTITRDGEPVVGVKVYFQRADETVISSAMTDSAGVASEIVEQDGAFVTAVDPFPSREVPDPQAPVNHDLRTFAGVKPGDDLVLNHEDPVSISVSLALPEPDGFQSYEVYSTCGSGFLSPNGSGFTGSVTLAGCDGKADFLVIVNANLGEGGDQTCALYHPNATVGDNARIDLTQDTCMPIADRTFELVNIPDDTQFMNFQHHLLTPNGMIFTPFGAQLGVEGATRSVTFREPTLAGVTHMFEVGVRRAGAHNLYSWGALKTSFDLATMLPDITTVEPGFAKETRIASWTEGTAAIQPELAISRIHVLRNEGEGTWDWSLVAPYTAGQVKYPALADFAFAANHEVTVDELSLGKLPQGYDVVRPTLHDLRDGSSYWGTAAKITSGTTGTALTVQPSFQQESLR